ncbi:uncharacterized protein LOC115892396 [Rhinopithecus roxellana]|uniref:uncharacterized protein LOC115892396 n=1 Tax=Rhinopithecus roxellana TaxID=61622 RepID=UPI00123778DB|nr:uncharacterized protein LOC115892396 [Rhinopithecus roxellana]
MKDATHRPETRLGLDPPAGGCSLLLGTLQRAHGHHGVCGQSPRVRTGTRTSRRLRPMGLVPTLGSWRKEERPSRSAWLCSSGFSQMLCERERETGRARAGGDEDSERPPHSPPREACVHLRKESSSLHMRSIYSHTRSLILLRSASVALRQPLGLNKALCFWLSSGRSCPWALTHTSLAEGCTEITPRAQGAMSRQGATGRN